MYEVRFRFVSNVFIAWINCHPFTAKASDELSISETTGTDWNQPMVTVVVRQIIEPTGQLSRSPLLSKVVKGKVLASQLISMLHGKFHSVVDQATQQNWTDENYIGQVFGSYS